MDTLDETFPDVREAAPAMRALPRHLLAGAASGSAEEYGIQRELRETRLNRAAPIDSNLIPGHVATHALRLSKSF